MGQSNDKPQKFYSFQKKEEPKKDQPPTDLKTKVRITITLDNIDSSEYQYKAFEINEQELFSRITKPYEIVIKAESENGIATKREKLDVFEAWNTIYNRDLRKYVR